MKIKALWGRNKVAPSSHSVFALLENGQLLYISPEEKYQGTDKNENRIYKDTGNPDISNAFDKDDRFDFNKADFFIRHFGGELIVKF